MDISNLMSPPEPRPYDNFGLNIPGRSDPFGPGNIQHRPLSPPISPYTHDMSNAADNTPHAPASTDPILYPAATPEVSQAPLFREGNDHVVEKSIQSYISLRSPAQFSSITPPSKEDYKLVASFQMSMKMGDVIFSNASKWGPKIVQETKDLNRRITEARSKPRVRGARPPQPTTPSTYLHIRPAAKPQPTRAQPSRSGAGRNIGQHEDAITLSVSPPRPVQKPVGGVKKAKAASPQPKQRVKPVKREEHSYDEVPDFTPPLSTIPNEPGCMKPRLWNGAHLDLSNDPLRHLLHKEELRMISELRVDCATYLSCKRRIFVFATYLRRKSGKEFKKTNAQQACHIDVNKASRIHEVFDNLGWFDAKWLKPHFDKPIPDWLDREIVMKTTSSSS